MKKLNKVLLAGLMSLVAGTSSAATFVGDRTDFRDETIYFAMTTRFYDGDPKNNVCCWDKVDVQRKHNDPDWRGDFAGLIEKLDYIKALGFTAIWITPVVQNASGEDYHGYHSMDFSSVDLRYESRKEWGSAKDVKFQDLIDAAHAKGMKIVLDVVLQHTSNFGEAYLNPLFVRDQNIRNQATPAGALTADPQRLSANYFDQTGKAQYEERWKYFKNPEYEPNNYYHHYGTGWNWDLPNRWWGQIAGDCVDLNTENDYVADYIVKCYGKFIEMGVDAFRIDTTGHISPLTFNKQFTPRFQELGEKYKSKRLNGAPFYMFGECCQRFQGSVVYRDQPNLSSYFYTWKSDQALLDKFDGSSEWWKSQNLPEGHDTPVGPMAVCESDTKDKPRSNNVWLQNGQWHEPDYSQASGLNVIDFPVHYSFGSVGNLQGLFSQDNYYNDASFNVVYVDSHDYCPGPNDGTRFNGGTEQWAENLSWMFTFRGIPCIYYGSEVEFKKGMPIDVGGENNKTPRSQSGRAYFGEYLEGDVTASDFGQYTASGNVDKTLNADLAQHIRRLNLIRAAVPALRKGQYTFDGCEANGGWAFKRGYKDSYALVAINGGATFTDVPAGTYTDIVTGQTYSGSSITVDAPSTKGQVRVLVKDWKGGKVGEDGKFIYSSSPVAHGGDVTFEDKGASFYYTPDDIIGKPSISFSPNGGSFKTETLTVTVSLNEIATSGWYQVGNGTRETLSVGATRSFTIGQNMNYGETVTVNWGVSGDDGKTYNGSVTYKKVDPNAAITVYVKAPAPFNMYAWTEGTEIRKLLGEWPGKQITATTEVGGQTFYYQSFDDVEKFNVILNNNGAQTGNLTGIDGDVYYEYDGASTAKKIDAPGPVVVKPKVTASPVSGTTFTDDITVTLTATPAVAIHYTIDGTNPSASSATYSQPLNFTETTTLKTFVENENGSNVQTFTYTKTDEPTPPTPGTLTIKGDYNLAYSGDKENVHYWGGAGQSSWPGVKMQTATGSDGKTYKVAKVTEGTTGIIFNTNGNANQTGNLQYKEGFVHDDNGATTTAVVFDRGDVPVPVEQTYTYYFRNDKNWSTVHAYVWDEGNGNMEYLGQWPGKEMTKEGDLWKVSFKTSNEVVTPKIIFNGGSDSNKTDNFAAVNNGIYRFSGFDVEGIDRVSSETGVKIYTEGCAFVVDSPLNTFVTVVSVDGRSTIFPVEAGITRLPEMAPGIYIVNARKYILR